MYTAVNYWLRDVDPSKPTRHEQDTTTMREANEKIIALALILFTAVAIGYQARTLRQSLQIYPISTSVINGILMVELLDGLLILRPYIANRASHPRRFHTRRPHYITTAPYGAQQKGREFAHLFLTLSKEWIETQIQLMNNYNLVFDKGEWKSFQEYICEWVGFLGDPIERHDFLSYPSERETLIVRIYAVLEHITCGGVDPIKLPEADSDSNTLEEKFGAPALIFIRRHRENFRQARLLATKIPAQYREENHHLNVINDRWENKLYPQRIMGLKQKWKTLVQELLGLTESVNEPT